jgi:hypothetical protein
MLIECGADINSGDDYTGSQTSRYTIVDFLVYTADDTHFDLIRFSLEHDANVDNFVDVLCSTGTTRLKHADSCEGRRKTVEILLEYGPYNPCAEQPAGIDSTYWSIHDQIDIIWLLPEHGARREMRRIT